MLISKSLLNIYNYIIKLNNTSGKSIYVDIFHIFSGFLINSACETNYGFNNLYEVKEAMIIKNDNLTIQVYKYRKKNSNDPFVLISNNPDYIVNFTIQDIQDELLINRI